LFVAGPNLYRAVKGATTWTKIQVNDTADFTLSAPGAAMARVGKYAYLIDGQSTTPLYRINLDATPAATIATTPSAPSPALSVSLTNQIIDDFSSVTGWSSRPAISTAELLTNTSFETNSGGPYANPTGWTQFGNSPNCITAAASVGNMTPYNGSYAQQMDDAGGGIYQDAAAPTITGGPVGSARVYKFSGRFHQADKTGVSSMLVTLYGLDGGGHILGSSAPAELTFAYNADTSAAGWVIGTVSLSLTGLASDPVSVRLEMRGGNNNVKGFTCLYVDSVSLKADDNPLKITQAPGAFTLSSTDLLQGGNFIKKTYTAKDFSGSNVVALAFSSPDPTIRPALRLVFHKTSDPSTTFYPSNLLTYAEDGTYTSVDITTIPLSVRQSVDALYLQIAGDLSDGDPNNLFTIGPLTAAGNLAISDGVNVSAGPYQYVFTEVQATSDGDIESDPSPISNAVAATGLKAIAQMTIPAQTNAAATHYQIYRYGGLYGDATGRLVARVQIAAGADQPAFDASHSYTWLSASRAFVDDTPDGALLLASTLITGRGAPPAGARALCEWQGRLWLAVGSTLWGSWLITGDTPGALYYNAVSYPDDPSASIKGFRVSVGGLDNDPIQQLIPLSTALIILKQRSVWVLTGFDASDFQLSGHYLKAGVGCVAPRAAALAEGQLWFLGPNGVYQFDGGDTIDPRSVPIERALNPSQSGGTAIAASAYAASAYAASAMIYHGRRMYLFAPRAGDTTSKAAYVWDSRQDGWTRYLWPAGVSINGAASLSTGLDGDDLFLAGSDAAGTGGQLYQLTGQGDKATPAATAQAVAFAMASRGLGRESGGVTYWETNRPTRMYAAVQTGESAVLTFGVTCSGSAAAMAAPYTVNGLASVRLKVPSAVRGQVTTVTISGATVAPTRLSSIACEIAEGRLNG
jgi:hypothetical protein